MPKPLPRGCARLLLSVAAGCLASPLALAQAPDPFAPFPAAEGEASDPRIEALRASLRPEAFKPTHDVVMSDAIYFLAKDLRGYIKDCGGDPSLTTLLPKEGTPATPFRVRFENPAAPIRAYIGDGYACTFPVRFGPLEIGYDAPPTQGLITYSDGSYWLGEVKGGANPRSRESNFRPVTTGLTPTPAGLGEWGRPDGSRVQGMARTVPVAVWPKAWGPASVVGFEMTSVERTLLPDGRLLAGNPPRPGPANAPGAAVPAPAAATPPAAAAIAAPATAAAAKAVAPANDDASSPVIERWRGIMASFDAASARQSLITPELGKPGPLRKHRRECARSAQPQPFRLTFSQQTGMKSFIGFTPGCEFPDKPSNEVFGIIEYSNGATWLGQVTATPAPRLVQVSTWGGPPSAFHVLIPSPNGLGELVNRDGERIQGEAQPVPLDPVSRENWMTRLTGTVQFVSIQRVVSPEGTEFTGNLRLTSDGLEGDSAAIRMADGRVFTGSVAKSLPVSGTLVFPGGDWVKGKVALDEAGVLRFQPGTRLSLSVSSQAVPPGRYIHYGTLPFNVVKPELLPLRFASPLDAATLARAPANTGQCPQPPLVPAGWVVWWPSCETGERARVFLYSPDARQELVYFPGGKPKRFMLRKGNEAGQLRGIEILADAFSGDPIPSPVGNAELRLQGQTIFFGNFVAQRPTTGQCPVPAYDGGGWEPCQYSRGVRVDMAQKLRLERQELARQQDALRDQMEEAAAAERYAQERWEAEQEEAEMREQKQQDELAGQMAIVNAIQGAAGTISSAYLEREQARQDLERRQREAARPRYVAPTSSGSSGGPRGAGDGGRTAQLAAKQAELDRRQAELQQRQRALASAPRTAPATTTAASSGGGATSSPAAGGGTESYRFTIADHNVGRVSATRQILGLAVTLEIKRVGLRISGADRSEICANFENRTAADWSGGYRLTDQDANDTRVSMSVPAGGSARKCETLNPQSGYTVVLRQSKN